MRKQETEKQTRRSPPALTSSMSEVENEDLFITDEELDIALGYGSSSDDIADGEDKNDDTNIQSPERILNVGERDGEYSSIGVVDDTTEDDRHSYVPTERSGDFFTSALEKLLRKDTSFRTLEICNSMDWDFDRWRDKRTGELNSEAFFQAICHLLFLAEQCPHVEQLELSNIPLEHPLLAQSVANLISSREGNINNNAKYNINKYKHSTSQQKASNVQRSSWSRIAVDECSVILPLRVIEAMQGTPVKSLHFTNNHLAPACVAAIGDILCMNKILSELRVTEHFTTSGMLIFAKGLASNENLVRLDLLGSTFFEDDRTHPSRTISSLAFGLERNQGLRTISLSHCKLQDHQLSMIVKSIQSHRSLSWLDLSNNYCGLQTCSELVTLLTDPNTDVDNNDGDNDDDDDNSSHEKCSLKGLSLNSCNIGDLEIIRLGAALLSNSTLEHIHLGENNITDDGIRHFSRILKRLTTLKSLWVLENSFGDVGGHALLEAVQNNVELEQLLVDRHISYFESIQFYVMLNRGGRRLLSCHNNVPLALWSLLFERCTKLQKTCRRVISADVVYYLLLQGPALMANPNVIQKRI